MEHLNILWPFGSDELWPRAVGTCTYLTFQNKYVELHTSPTGSIANFELPCIGHDLSIPTGNKV
jgi:hypothetical protein